MGSKPKKLSASRVSSILGINPFKSEFDLWLDIIEEEYPGWLNENGYSYEKTDISSEPQIRIGNIFEESVIKKASNCEYFNREKFFEKGILSCHIDAETSSGLIEAKTTNHFTFWKDWGTPYTDEIPDYYYCQAQVQMGLSGQSKTCVPVLIFPNRQSAEMCDAFESMSYNDLDIVVLNMSLLGLLKNYVVNFDDKIYNEIESRASEWWEIHIVRKEQPSISDCKSKIILPLHGELKADENICDAIKLYKTQDADSKEKISETGKTRQAILDYMLKNANSGRSDFVRIKKDGKVLASFNAKTGRFMIKGEKNEN